jgi:hypothetical protein
VSPAPGQNVTINTALRTRRGQDHDGTFRFTPGMVPAPNGVVIDSARL